MVDFIIDTNVIIGITHLYLEKVTHPRNRREVYLFEIKELIEDGKINAIITPTVLQEIKKGRKKDNGLAEKFVNRFCEVANFNQYAKDKALILTDAYGNYPIDEKPAIVLAEDYTQRNYCDATIIAEATVEQKLRKKVIPFLTENLKDVCDEAKINQINKRHNVPAIHIHSLHTIKEAIEIGSNLKI